MKKKKKKQKAPADCLCWAVASIASTVGFIMESSVPLTDSQARRLFKIFQLAELMVEDLPEDVAGSVPVFNVFEPDQN